MVSKFNELRLFFFTRRNVLLALTTKKKKIVVRSLFTQVDTFTSPEHPVQASWSLC